LHTDLEPTEIIETISEPEIISSDDEEIIPDEIIQEEELVANAQGWMVL